MNITSKQFNIFVAAAGGVFIWLFLTALLLVVEGNEDATRYIKAIGGGLNGYIQALCYGLGTYVFLELRNLLSTITEEYKAFDLKLLPEREHLLLKPEEVIDLRLDIIRKEKDGMQNMLLGIIKKVCNQFRNDHSIQDTYSMLSSQIRTTKDTLESRLEPLRYIVSVITMLGFIGTIIGLTNAIFHAAPLITQVDPAGKAEGFSIITSDFSLAFGSTLVALLLVIVLNRYYHNYLAKLDTYFATAETYITDNLVSRIYNARQG